MSPTRRHHTLAVAGIALLLTGTVGSAAAGAQSRAHPSAVRDASGASVTITQADSGRSYTLAMGDRLTVRLTGPGYATWTKPSSSSSKVLARRSATTGSTARATFVAVAAGTAAVTASDVARCAPQCSLVTRQFHVSITVS